MADNDYIIENFRVIRYDIDQLKQKIDSQSLSIVELKEKTLPMKDANRFDLFASVLRENPSKTYITIWLIMLCVYLDKEGIASKILMYSVDIFNMS